MRFLSAFLALTVVFPAVGATREELKREREAIEAEHARRAEACKTQFVVTPCLDTVRVQKQKALSHVLSLENALDAAERQARVEARQKRLADKAAAAQAASAVAVPAPASAVAPPRKPAKVRQKPAQREDRSAREEEKRAAFEARQREIQQHKQEVEKRNAERARTKPAPRPLPLPPSAASR